MRWYVSIGAVLVAGVLASGDVAGIAAPSSKNQIPTPGRQLADKESTPSVDVELILAVDVSYSMDMDELAIQREGYAQAIVSKEFLQALKSGPNGKISVTYFEWAASSDQKIIIPWRVIDGPETADAVANEIMKTPIRRTAMTFTEWKVAADKHCQDRHGVSLDDLPDCYYSSWFDEGHSPEWAAR